MPDQSLTDTTSSSIHGTEAKDEGIEIQYVLALMTYLN